MTSYITAYYSGYSVDTLIFGNVSEEPTTSLSRDEVYSMVHHMKILYTNGSKSKVHLLYGRWNVILCVGNLMKEKYYVSVFELSTVENIIQHFLIMK
jgi:hypothetical protein